jgi:hypothetical protein
LARATKARAIGYSASFSSLPLTQAAGLYQSLAFLVPSAGGHIEAIISLGTVISSSQKNSIQLLVQLRNDELSGWPEGSIFQTAVP